MLHSIEDANTYVIDRIEKITNNPISEEEKMSIEFGLKNLFYDRLSEYISDEEIESLGAENEEDLEGKLFYKVPNYVTLVEACASQYLAEYFVGDYFDQSDFEGVEEEINI